MDKTIAKLIAKAWLDKDFYTKLIVNPVETLREEGVTLKDSTEVIVNPDSLASPAFTLTEGDIPTYEINIPPKPNYLTDEQMNLLNASTFLDNISWSCCSC